MAISIGAEAINTAGFVALAVLSLYMLFAYGSAIRSTGSISFGRTTSYVSRVVRDDFKTVFGGIAAVVVGALGWTIGFANLGAAFGGLVAWASGVWFWFTSGIVSLTNAIGITDFGIMEILFFAVAFGVAAAIAKAVRQ